MRYILAVLLAISLTGSAFAAELLVKAKPHWQDAWKADDVDKLSVDEKRSYESRSQIGDVIVVRPDGWKWGKEECLPNFVVIKIPDLKVEDAKKYEEALYEEVTNEETKEVEQRILKRRKHQIPKTVIDGAKIQLKSELSVTKEQKPAFISNIIEKTE